MIIINEYNIGISIQLIRSMNALKTILKSSLTSDPFDTVYWGDSSSSTFADCLKLYHSSSKNSRQAIKERLVKKLGKQKTPKIAIGTLHLWDKLMENGLCIAMPEQVPKCDLSGCESEKEKVMGKNFHQLYYKFLRFQSLKPEVLLINPSQVTEKLVAYCECADESISLVLQMDFLITHCLNSSKHQAIFVLSASSIMNRVSQDLNFLTTFINENCGLITEKHEFSFRINHLYERSIFFTKQASRLKLLFKRLSMNNKVQFYQMDSETNKRIEREMLEREGERKEFLSQKMIKSSPLIRRSEGSESEISEEDMLMEDFLI